MDPIRAALMAHYIKVEGLLDPLTRMRRNKTFGIASTDGLDLKALARPTYVHYTSADAAIQIMKNKQMWMRNTSCMDDWSEVRHGHQILCDFFELPGRRDRFFEVCNSVFVESGNRILAIFDGWWRFIQFNTFITSVSEHHESENQHGRLSMWRAFGGQQARVALVFRPPAISEVLEKLHVMMRPVLYATKADMHDNLELMISNIDENKEFFSAMGADDFISQLVGIFVGLSASLKHSAFAEEQEWRLVYLPKMYPSPHMIKKVVSIRGNPQIIYQFPLGSDPDPDLQVFALERMLERVIIGPTVYSSSIYDAFVECLSDAGVPDPAEKVVTSGIPLR